MNHHLIELKVSYKVFKQNVCEGVDRKIEKIANEQGLEFLGSGFDFKKQERDLHFGSEFLLKKN